jgi:hypothetical protein
VQVLPGGKDVKTPDYSRFDTKILAPRAMKDWGINPGDLYIIEELLSQGASEQGIIQHMHEWFPAWKARERKAREKEMRLFIRTVESGALEE